MNEEILSEEDFEELLDLGELIIIPPKTDITIQCVHSEVKGMSPGKVLMREEQHIMFLEEECFLIPSGLFDKIIEKIKAKLVEKGTDDDEGRREPGPGEPSIH